MLLRVAFLLMLAFLLWRLWRSWQMSQTKPRPPAPPDGFANDSDPMVRCERCGVRVPSSQVANIRSNCKICNGNP